MQRLEATVATLRAQCRQLQLASASGQPTAVLRPRAARPVTPSRGRRKPAEHAPSVAPAGTLSLRSTAASASAASASAEPGGAAAAASAQEPPSVEGAAEGAGRPLGASAPSSASSASSTVRELELRLERATATSGGLVLLWAAARWPQQAHAMPGEGGPQSTAQQLQLAEAWSRALPGAAEALQALGKRAPAERDTDALAVSYLRLLWHARPPAAPAAGVALAAYAAGRAGAGDAAGGAAPWERRLLRHLANASSQPAGGACFGAGSQGALLSALLMLRLAQRGSGMHARGGGGGALADVIRAVEVLRQLVAVVHDAAAKPELKAGLLALGGLREVQPLLLSPHRAVCMPAAALLLSLCTDTDSPSAHTALDAVASEPFFRVAAAALKMPQATRGDDSLAARLCVLLQLVSQRPGTHTLFGIGDLRGTLTELQHTAPSDFVQANVRSILQNIEARD